MFPLYRFRRLRRSETIRRLVRETHLHREDLVAPLFVCHGKGVQNPIASMPGQFRWSVDKLVEEVKELWKRGVLAVILFGIPQTKDEKGSEALSEKGVIPQAIRAIKDAVPEICVIADLCFCEYTDHGHCGVLSEGEVDNDATLELLGKQAVVLAKSGADFVAPSGMMDGMVGGIRDALDEEGFTYTGILSYAAKYASSLYGPFREAADSAPQFGDRKGYQMDPANGLEAVREVELDIEEGADIVMVKPASFYLDVLYRIKTTYGFPTAAYQVSGEYAMIEAACEKGWLDRHSVILESLLSIKRAGADVILTYFAKEIADKI